MENAAGVPAGYLKQAAKQWWKYKIPQFFPAYKPDEIDCWSAEKILEHLAIVAILEKDKK